MNKIEQLRNELKKEAIKHVEAKANMPMSNNYHWHDGRMSGIYFALNKLNELVEKSGKKEV